MIELLVGLAVLAMLAALGVPSFTRIVERQRIEASMQRLAADLALARTTAMTRRQPVILCPRDPHGDCQPGLDWSHGWIVMKDGASSQPLWVQQSLSGASLPLRVTASRTLLRYRHDGTSTGSNLTFSLCLRGQVVAQQIVNNSGRARRHLPSGGEPCPEN